MNRDLYIGYLAKMPASFKRVIKPTVALIVVLGGIFAVLFATGQQPFADSVFEFGNVKQFEGTIQARPVPFLLVEKDELNNGLPTFFRYPLVGEGKHGVGNLADLDGERAKLEGTLIYRDGIRMIEVATGTLERSGAEKDARVQRLPGDIARSLGSKTLRGEIIDSKCYLGVMNPGNRKSHRDCAVACLRGGVPAMFVVEDVAGNKSELWLLSATGESINNEILDYVAEPVELSGRVTREGDQLFFYVNPSNIKRL